MKFTNLVIENFLAISSAKINLADRGLCLIQGENLDDSSATSNGAGKSSIPDALCWVLTDETARGDSGDAVINDKAGKGTLVQVDVEEGDDVYRISRHRKHAKHKNSLTVLHLAKDGTITDLTKGTDKLTQAVVDKIIGASPDVFRASIYAAQEQMPDLPAMTDKNLKVLIEEASGVTLLEAAYKEARTRLDLAKTEVAAATDNYEKVVDRKDFTREQIATATVSRDAWKIDQQTRISALKAEIATRIATVRAMDADIAKIDEATILAGIADCDAKLASLGGEQKKRAELATKVTQAEAKVTLHRRDAANLQNEHKALKQQIADLDATVGQPCHECGRDHDNSTIAIHKGGLVKKANDIAKRFADAKKLMDDAASESGKLTSELQAFEASMTDPSATSSQRASLAAENATLQQMKRDRAHEAARAKDLGDQVKRLAADPNPHEASLADFERKMQELDADLIRLNEKLKDCERVRDHAEAVVKVFSPAGVRAHILDEVTPYLNQQTAKYLDTLSDGNIAATWTTLVRNAKGELREKFSIEVNNNKGGKRFSSLSGGEKRKVRVATALALQDLVATRATKPIELFIGDEIDDALDAAGLERLTQILEEKAKERGSVFIISHSDLKDWISQVVTVRKKDGETLLIEETV
jgi:DNA repair exonuclease SbcCD ATPase subunit